MNEHHKTAIFVLGGNISTYKNQDNNGIFTLEEKKHLETFLPEIKGPHVKIFFLPTKLSFHTLKDFEVLYNSIKKRLTSFDSFVILQESDTLIFGASLISYMLGKIYKPIIFISSPQAFSFEPGNPALKNLRDALLLGTKDIGETVILHSGRIIRAVRAKRQNIMNPFPFYSAQIDDLGRIEEEEVSLALHRINKNSSAAIDLPYTFPTAHVVFVRTYPGMSASVFYHLAKQKNIDGVCIEGLGYGSFPDDIFEAILFLEASGIYVAILAEHDSPQRKLHLDIDNFNSHNIPVLKNMTVWGTFAKMHFAVANTASVQEFAKFMKTPFGGDIIE